MPNPRTGYLVKLRTDDGRVVGVSEAVTVGGWNPPPPEADKPDGDKDEGDKDEIPWIPVGVWCDRVAEEGSTAVVCEISVTDFADFGSYVLKRNGAPIWSYNLRTQAGRDPGQTFVSLTRLLPETASTARHTSRTLTGSGLAGRARSGSTNFLSPSQNQNHQQRRNRSNRSRRSRSLRHS
ncbi:MAG: hypothetical protein ACKVHU_21100 [Acidimicrobiales bacterium]